MITYKIVSNPTWVNKHSGKRVSFFGSLPCPIDDYTIEHFPSIKINRNGKITYSNYFFGKIIKTEEEAKQTIEKLNNI